MTLSEFEREVFETEGFRVKVTDKESGRDIRDDRSGFEKYDYRRKARSNWTVGKWKRERFNGSYPGFDVEILDAMSEPVTGQMKLKNVRSDYE